VAPGTSTQAAYDKACRELSKQIAIPGFRKGAKIPAQVLEQAMAAKGGRQALRKQAINSLLSQLIEPTLKQEYNLEPIGQPTLLVSVDELANTFVPGEELQLQVQCDVWPDLQWKQELSTKPYLGLAGTYQRKPFHQAKLDATLRDLQERYAILEPKDASNNAVLEMGDACTVQMEGYWALPDGSKGDPLPNAASGENVQIILGLGRYMEGLVEGLVGAQVGDTKTISVQFPKVTSNLFCW
jgi:trigger factor